MSAGPPSSPIPRPRLLAARADGVHPSLFGFCEELYADGSSKCPHVRYVLFDHHSRRLESGLEPEQSARLALKMLQELESVDGVRANYLTYLRNRVNNLTANTP